MPRAAVRRIDMGPGSNCGPPGCYLCGGPASLCVTVSGFSGSDDATSGSGPVPYNYDGTYPAPQKTVTVGGVTRAYWEYLRNDYTPAPTGISYLDRIYVYCEDPCFGTQVQVTSKTGYYYLLPTGLTCDQVVTLCAGGTVTRALYAPAPAFNGDYPASITAQISLGPCPGYGPTPVMMAAYAPPLVAPASHAVPAVRIAVAAPPLRRVAPALAGRVLGGLPMVAACRHEGPVVAPCVACGDKDANHVRACGVHGECTRSGADATRPGCQACPEYAADD